MTSLVWKNPSQSNGYSELIFVHKIVPRFTRGSLGRTDVFNRKVICNTALEDNSTIAMKTHSLLAISTVSLLTFMIATSSITGAFSQSYQKEWQVESLAYGDDDVGPLHKLVGEFSVPSDATDARVSGRVEGHGGDSKISVKIVQKNSCSDTNNFNTCKVVKFSQEKALVKIDTSVESGQTYLFEFWNGAIFDTKQVEYDIELGYNKLVEVSSGSSSSGGSSGGGGCLIATAAFGSELTPQVQFLRDFRDNRILSTAGGSSFMYVFNTWYYSFSPYVADYERQQPWLQQTVKTAIYPLLGILQLAEKSYAIVPGEYGSIAAGLLSSSLIGAVYFMPIALPIKQVRTRKLDPRIAIAIIAALSTGVVISLAADNSIAMMTSTAALVLAALFITAIYSAQAVWKGLKAIPTKSRT